MLLRRLYLLAAALVLVLGSTSTCALISAHALTFKSAHRACASLAAAVPGESAALTSSRIKEKCAALAKWTVGVLVALNTPVAMTDSNGDTVNRTAYSAWGEIEEQVANGVVQAPWQLPSYNPDVTGQAALLSNDGQSIGFTGYQKDEATGLYYAGARWYDPLIGGFNAMDPWAGNSGHPITFNKYLYSRSNPLSYIDPDGKVSFLSTMQEYLRGTVQSYETQREQAILEGAGGRAFGLGVGKTLSSAGEVVISGLNTTSNLIAQHHYEGDVYEQTQRELRSNEAGAGEIIAGGHVLGQKVYDDPIGTAQQVGTSAVDFADRLAARDPRALGTAGEIVGGLLIPAGGAGKKTLDEALDAARIAARLDFDASDIVRDLDEGLRPANAAHGVRTVEKPSGGVGVVAEKVEIAKPYKRPSGSTTPAQRESVQGKPCVKCGTETPTQVAGHKKAIVEEYYETGTIDKKRMRSLDAVQSECPTCSAREGAEMSRYSRIKKKELDL